MYDDRLSISVGKETLLGLCEGKERRVELCQDERHVVVRHDGPPLDDACEPGPGDRVIVFDR